jgi:hypothetical protein
VYQNIADKYKQKKASKIGWHIQAYRESNAYPLIKKKKNIDRESGPAGPNMLIGMLTKN